MDFPRTNNQPAPLQTSNPHADRHDDFNNERLFKRLEEKHRPKPYWKQYQRLYYVVFGTSFLFHLLSAATAAALIYFFLFGIFQNEAAAGAVTLAALAALEYAKRETSGRFFQNYLQFRKIETGLLIAVVGLSAISTAASYFGAAQAVKVFTPPPVLEAPPATADNRDQVAEIDRQISEQQKNTWNGKLNTRAARTIEKLTAAKLALIESTAAQTERTAINNAQIQEAHTTATETSAAGFALFTLCSEILLIVALFYLTYYDFRSFAEYSHATAGASTGATTGASSINTTTIQTSPTEAAPRPVVGFKYGNQPPAPTAQRTCDNCGAAYTHGHARQKFCSESCRIDNWKKKNGRNPHRVK